MPLLFLLSTLLAAAPQAPASELSAERAAQILPRADLNALTDAQRAQFLEIAGDTFDYAGCNDTLAQCLRAGITDRHALRMTELVKGMLVEGYSPSVIIDFVERYYQSFAASKRQKLADSDCPQLGDPKAPVAVVEFSDFQCPHCAAAEKPLHDLVAALPGKVRLCSKYFPLSSHPRAHQAAAAAEYAARHKKFWEMSELLFGHQDELEDGNLKAYAKQLGLDGAEMVKEIYAGKFDAAIDKQMKEGLDAGVRATPTLYFNGRQFMLPLKSEFLVFSAQDEEEWQRNKGGWDK
jgi:protein-disulfide isomerase